MPNVLPALNEHIQKLARREVRAQTRVTKRVTAQYRHDIAGLKRLVKSLVARLGSVEKHASRGSPVPMTPSEPPANTRFRADGLKSHRTRMGLSAKEFGMLVGVSALTVYNWEAGKSRPRRKQLASLIAVRGLGKREAEERLALLAKKK